VWIALVACSDQATPLQPGAIRPAGELQEELGLYAENRATIRLDPDEVPADLRDLIPFAEQWGIGDDIIRADFEEKSSDAEKQRFKLALTGRTAAVNAWLDSLPQGEPMSEEAAAFMYMLLALDEMKLWPN
jgi:hypothetical protein